MCEDQFDENAFTSTLQTKLIKFALPLAPLVENSTNIILDENFSELPSSDSLPKINVSNVLIKASSNAPSAKRKLEFCNDITEEPLLKKPRLRNGILNQINVTRIGNLTPRKRKFYFINREQRNRISRLKNLSRA